MPKRRRFVLLRARLPRLDPSFPLGLPIARVRILFPLTLTVSCSLFAFACDRLLSSKSAMPKSPVVAGSASALTSSSATDVGLSRVPRLKDSSSARAGLAVDRGCVDDLEASGKSSAQQVVEAGRICFPGMRRVTSAKAADTNDGRTVAELSIDLPAHACARIAAATSSDALLTVSFVRDGRDLLVAPQEPSPSVLPRGGPWCVTEQGTYLARVRASVPGDLAIGLWMTEPAAP